MIEIRTAAEVDEMRPAGAFVASVVAATAAASAVGVNLLALDRLAGDMIRRAGAVSSYVDYHPSFGASVDVTSRALEAGIAAARPGNRMGDVSAAIGAVAHEAGLSVNLEFGGHGVGRTMHGDPHVPNDGRAKRGLPLRAGLVFAIEPWFMLGTDKIYTDRDGWTLRSADGSRAAHFEHTVAVTDGDPLVLTRPQ